MFTYVAESLDFALGPDGSYRLTDSDSYRELKEPVDGHHPFVTAATLTLRSLCYH